MKKTINPTKVITGKDTRFSYLIVNEPKAINGGTPKYSVSLIIPKTDMITVEKCKAAIKAAYDEGQSKLKGNGKSVPALTAIKMPLRDGDEERPDDPAYGTQCRGRWSCISRRMPASGDRDSSPKRSSSTTSFRSERLTRIS